MNAHIAKPIDVRVLTRLLKKIFKIVKTSIEIRILMRTQRRFSYKSVFMRFADFQIGHEKVNCRKCESKLT